MEIRVLVCDPIDIEGIKRLEDKGFKIDEKTTFENECFEDMVKKYDVLIVRSRTKITKEIINQCKKLKVTGRAASGLDNIDLEAVTKRGIKILNTPEAPADSVAELTIGLMLTLIRNIIIADRSLKKGEWRKKELKGSLLRGKTLGLIGLGNIGIKVANLAKEFGMNILITKRTEPASEILQALDAKYVPLQDLLMKSDIISIHVPLNQETYHMINTNEIKLMKNRAYLINLSRGGVVNEDALYEALISKKLSGVALDVYELEPPKNFKLIKLPNVVCTPHIGAQTKEAQRKASIILSEKIIRFFSD
jgi:D-3-phosphoglycerate dehydrogenase